MAAQTSHKTQLVIDNDYASLIYYPDYKIVHHSFKKPIGGEAFRSVLIRGIELLKQHGATKWLSDDRANSALPEEDAKWGTEWWFPHAQAVGWKHWGLIVPDDTLGRIDMSKFVFDFAQKGVRVALFPEPAKGLDWLISLQD